MRTWITTLVLLLAPAIAPADPPPGRCCREGGCGVMNPVRPRGPGAMAAGPGMTAEEHGPIFDLLSRHDTISRTVKEIPGGVRTTTTTSDPELVATLRTHVRQMTSRLEQGRPVRMWDPVFRGVFAHADEIAMTLEDIDGGIEVTETSENPEAVAWIRAHAAKVSTFVAGGHAAARPPWAGGGRGRMRHGR